jgi:hypothetical protein
MRPNRVALVFSTLLLASALAPVCSVRADELDRGVVFVTGSDLRERPDGISRCFAQVLAKVSGDPTLADDPRLAPIAENAVAMVEDFVYLDRMSGIPLHDEQGTRDRPFDLVVNFDPRKIDAALAMLGHHPWRAERPALFVLAAIRDRTGAEYTLSADLLRGEPQRRALRDAGERFGLRVILVPDADLASADTEASALLARVAGALKGSGDVVGLIGTVRWSEPDTGWDTQWRLVAPDGARTKVPAHAPWGITGASFDEAYRDGVGGAAAILSGNR